MFVFSRIKTMVHVEINVCNRKIRIQRSTVSTITVNMKTLLLLEQTNRVNRMNFVLKKIRKPVLHLSFISEISDNKLIIYETR